MVIEIVMMADNIDVMSALAECGDHLEPQKIQTQCIFQRGDNLIDVDSFKRPDVYVRIQKTTDANFTTKCEAWLARW